MHEMGLARGILRESLRRGQEKGARRITAVDVEVSPLAVVDVEDLALCFADAAKGTGAEDAELRIVRLPLVAECSECGESVHVQSAADTCPSCGSRSLEVKPMPDWQVTAVETVP